MTKPSLDLTANETIVAEATPPGLGGVAIVRISGPLVLNIMTKMLKRDLSPRQATHTAFYNHQETVIDIGIAIYFQAPNSFTGEDVLELQGHGGRVVVDLIIANIIKWGARLARPGEFSERAFLSGKIDLTQAEAISDLISAATEKAATLAMRSLQGEFSKYINDISDELTQLRIYVEAAIDFVDEQIDFISNANVIGRVSQIKNKIISLLHEAKNGSLLREGIKVVLAGAPNVGKSSLLNCLSGKELAIVTDIAGTTRDVLQEQLSLDGIPIHIVDTAGLREATDVIEQEGVRRAYLQIESADVILYLISAEDELTLPQTIESKKTIIVRNKVDLKNETPNITVVDNQSIVSISAKLNQGIPLLKQEIKHKIGYEDKTESLFLARRRHLTALENAQYHLTSAHEQLEAYHNTELAAEELRLAQNQLGEITGKITADDLLGRIFSSFCIGK